MSKKEFFDINRFPSAKGIWLLPISMSRMANAQDARQCWRYLEQLTAKLKNPEGVGMVFLYGDSLYLHSSEPAEGLKEKYLGGVLGHKKDFEGFLAKHPWFIKKAFTFLAWNQALIECKKPFLESLRVVERLYAKDRAFQNCVKDDVRRAGKSPKDEHAMKFVLEEAVLFHLITKGQVKISNDYVQGHEKWILYCYPGKPLRSAVYLSQKNPLKLKNPQNRYEDSFYDLEGKKLYNNLEIDLEKDEEVFG
jgi:hypothetical protein